MRPLTPSQARGLIDIARGRHCYVRVATAKQLAAKKLIDFRPRLSSNGTRITSWKAYLTKKGREELNRHPEVGR